MGNWELSHCDCCLGWFISFSTTVTVHAQQLCMLQLALHMLQAWRWLLATGTAGYETIPLVAL
jgi:hypothetical protein